ncbi:hypothetical protein [Ensifer adhaerens]|nr:hypothetical protein [Ensifer adhaerens]
MKLLAPEDDAGALFEHSTLGIEREPIVTRQLDQCLGDLIA